ncbi:MAG: cation:proton antiporter [Sandaracinus sp.]
MGRRAHVGVALALWLATAWAALARAEDAGLDAGVERHAEAPPDEIDAGEAEAHEAPPAEPAVDAGIDAARPAPRVVVRTDAAVVDAALPSDAGVDAASADAGPPPDAAVESDAGAALAVSEPPPSAAPPTPAAASRDVLRTLIGLVLLMVLAYVGGHPRVARLEQRLGIAQVMTSGLPFVFLGLVAQQPALDVLNRQTLDELLPLLQFGLGWIGFQTGFSFEARELDRVPRGTGTVVLLLSTFPFVVISGVTALVLWAVGLGHDPLALARDSCLLGLAGALSAPTLERVIGQRMSPAALDLARAIALLDDVLGVAALACLAAFLHGGAGGDDAWKLPGVGWIFVTFGMAVSIGLVVYVVLRGTDSGGEKTSLLLGSVALTAGLAGYLSLSPLVICFFAGILLRNLPSDDKDELTRTFRRLERPIYFLFLLMLGALWRIQDWRGWALLPVFVLARFAGRFAGARVARRLPASETPEALGEAEDRDLALPPMGQLALAFVVTAQTLYESPAVQAIVTAVVGGGVLLEIVVQISSRQRRRKPGPRPSAPPEVLARIEPEEPPPREPPSSDRTLVDEPAIASTVPAGGAPPDTTTEEAPE